MQLRHEKRAQTAQPHDTVYERKVLDLPRPELEAGTSIGDVLAVRHGHCAKVDVAGLSVMRT
ncbi:hypothetical protein LMG31841_05426 [Paraburkholderia saeva]|uniref:Uncharacterized protein n=1 Tax=Paraburkholderia saeva TaxID=2777537 RepID=A0A9N8S0S2_9BURK|nr:hypothetical protein R70241_03984 [Paraburkholderia saeva]CAG4924844.1 hypothetical protein LMG31841_05426 [Paraburkholderia saeva]